MAITAVMAIAAIRTISITVIININNISNIASLIDVPYPQQNLSRHRLAIGRSPHNFWTNVDRASRVYSVLIGVRLALVL